MVAAASVASVVGAPVQAPATAGAAPAAPIHAQTVSVGGLPAACSSSGSLVTCSFSYSGGDQSLTVPSPITSVTIDLKGGQGGGGGNGGEITGQWSLSGAASTTVTVKVGGAGSGSTSRTYPDGGAGGSGSSNNGCSGGGGTELWVGGVMIAGAGGGGGCSGNGTVAGCSGFCSGGGAAGGSGGGATGSGGGGGGGSSCTGGAGGGAGPSYGGSGGSAGCSGGGGGGGAQGYGGDGGSSSVVTGIGGGGGGGGGWYGGGGGGSSGDGYGGGGGGGGGSSGAVPAVAVAANNPGVNSGNGAATLSWGLTAPSISVAAPSSVPVGSATSITATVSDPAQPGYSPLGTVTFTDSTTGAILCSGASIVSGVATCAVPQGPGMISAIGTNTVTASYSGDGVLSSGSGTASVTGTTDPTTTTVTSGTVSGTGTPSIPLSATVTPAAYASGALTGTVQFSATDGTTTYTLCAAGPLNVAAGAAGTVNCTWADPPFSATATYGGAYTVTAAYQGDSTNAPSSGSTTLNVAKATTSTAVTATQPGTAYGSSATVSAVVSGIPSADTSPGSVTYSAGGVAIACTGSGQTNPAPVSASNGAAGSCTYVPSNTDNTVTASYGGDAQTSTSSGTTTVTVTPASASLSLAVEPAGGNGDVTVPLALVVTETNTVNTGVAPDVPVDFATTAPSTDLAVPASCAGVVPVPTGPDTSAATCAIPSGPTALSSISFSATAAACTVVTGGCSLWTVSGPSTVSASYTPGPDPTALVLSPSDTQVHPVHVSAGTSITVTATVSDTAGTQQPVGKVTFAQNGATITATSGATCSGLTPVAGASAGVASATCTFVPPAGSNVAVTATYDTGVDATDPLTLASNTAAAPYYVVVGGGSTATAVSLETAAGAPLASPIYGEPVLLVATVTSPAGTVGEGTVDFTVNGSPVTSAGATICQNVAVAAGTAVCSASYQPPAGGDTFGAAYADAGGAFLGSTGSSAVTVGAAPTSTAINAVPDPSAVGMTDLVVSVADAAGSGGVLPPTGTVTVTGGGASCNGLALVAVTGSGSSTATCTVATPSAVTSFTATFAPTSNAQFVGSTSSLSYPTATGACSGAFDALWTAAGAGSLSLGSGGFGTGADGMSFVASAPGTCTQASDIVLSQGTLSLFGSTLSGSGLGGYVAAGPSGARLCLDAGTAGLPAGWKLTSASLTLTPTASLCFGISAVTLTGSTVSSVTFSGASGQLTASLGTALPFGNPDGTVSYGLAVSFAAAGAGEQLVVSLAPTSATGSSPYVTATVTVDVSGGTVSASGAATLANLLVGGPVHATVAVGTGGSGAIAGSITVSGIGTSPITPVPGLGIEDVTVTLSSSGLHVTGTLLLGGSSSPATVAFAGGYAAGTWSLTVSSSPVTWRPFSSLSVSLSFTGSVTMTTSGTVSYDVEAGTPGATSPLFTWSPGAGITLAVTCVALAYGVAPTCDATAGAGAPVDPTLLLDASVTVGGAGGLTVGVDGSVDLHTGALTLALASPVTVTVATGFTVTVDALAVAGGVGQSIAVHGQATAQIAALGLATAPTVSITVSGGSLLVTAGGLDFSGVGVPITGFFAYSTGPVTGVATGDAALGTVDVTPGFNAFASLQVPSGLASTLSQAGFTLPPGGAITFAASWTPGSSPTFTAQLAAPSGFPFLALPGGGTLTSASLTYASDAITLAVAGTIPVPGSRSAVVSMTVTLATDGSFSGTATVTGLTVFGATVDLAGSVSRTAGGPVTAQVGTCSPTSSGCSPGPVAGPLTPFPGVPVTFSDVTVDLGTSGLTVAGTMSVAGLTSLSLAGTLTSLQNWSLTAALAAASPWTPVPGVTIDAVVSGTIADNNGPVTFDLSASGQGGAPLFSLSLGVDLAVSSVQLGNAAPPTGCTVANPGDLWLAAAGSLSASFGSATASSAASGCFDLTAHSLELSATLDQLGFTAAGGHVTVGAPTVVITESGSGFSVAGSVLLTVSMPSGGSFSQAVTVDFGSSGSFVIGGAVDLAQWLGAAGNDAYVYYASQADPNFATGVPALGTIALDQGVNFALTVTLPQSAANALAAVGIDVPSGSGLVALAQADFSTDVYTLRISMSLGAGGLTLFSAGGVSLALDTGYLQLQVSSSQMSFGVGLTATLNLPSLYSGDPGSSVGVDGQLTVGTSGVNVSLSLGQCGTASTGTAWTDAFGIPGLTVQCAQMQGGVTEGPPPFVNVGLAGTITSLPSVISDVIGYQDGAPISFAFNLDPLLLSLSIGTKNSGTPALEPLAYFGQGSLLQIDYASLYVSPDGATIGQTVYPAGLGLGFQASIDGVSIDVLADIGISPPSIDFTGSLGTVTLGGLSIGPTSLTIAASVSPPSFQFAFTGALNLGPGSVQIGPALQVGGGLSANVEIDISTGGISAFIWGSISVSVSVYVPTQVCYWEGFFPYPCDYQWEGTSGSFTLGKTGFSIDSSGVTLEADGYSITFGFNGSVSISTAYQVPATVPVTGGQIAQLVSYQVPPTGTARLVTVPMATAPSGTAGRAAISTLPPSTGGEVVHPATPATPGATLAPAGPPQVQVGTWGRTGPLASGAAYGSAVALTGGDVLQAGGVDAGGVLATAQVYDPKTGAWTVVGSMASARMGAAAVRLADGTVLVAGGEGADHTPLASAELYHPATRSWSATGSLRVARAFGAAVLLGDGDVLVAGGTGVGHRPLASAELYDPARGTWSSVAPMSVARAFAAAAPLPGGGALVAGGFHQGGELASAERFDPATRSWSAAGSMTQPRMMATAVALPGGDVLVVGDGAVADRYHPATGTWTATDGMSTPRTAAAVVALPGGAVLVAGGMDDGHALSSTERYDPVSGTWAPAGNLSAPRAFAAGAAMPDGGALVPGGADVSVGPGGAFRLGALGSTDRYTLPSGPPVPPGPLSPPLASVGISAGALVLGSAGGVFAVFLAGALVVAVLRRRRGLPPG